MENKYSIREEDEYWVILKGSDTFAHINNMNPTDLYSLIDLLNKAEGALS